MLPERLQNTQPNIRFTNYQALMLYHRIERDTKLKPKIVYLTNPQSNSAKSS